MKKKISIVVPTYNEEENVTLIAKEICSLMVSITSYDYELLFIDNASTDSTRSKIRNLCSENSKIKAIFNTRNFGAFNSPIHGLIQSTGDCAILMCADFQDPTYLIPGFIKEWENGATVVCAIKTASKENKLMYFLRTLYYKFIKKASEIEQLEHFTGFGLYDRSFINIIDSLHDPKPFLRGIVAEFAPDCVRIPYEQPKRKNGHTSTNFIRLYDAAMTSITAYTKIGIRVSTFIGGISLCISSVFILLRTIFKHIHPQNTLTDIKIKDWIFITYFSLQLFFIGILGEYVLSIHFRIMNRPLALELERINFNTNEVQYNNE